MILVRPIKDILLEEYWNIAYRTIDENEYIFIDKNHEFKALAEDKRYWYADPFVFEYKDKLFLFVESFDNIKEKGLIACSEFDGEKFSVPKIVLEEDFHLSFPFVFEENGEIFMMPETMDDGCIQLYKAVSFPYQWEKYKVLLHLKNAVDTIKVGNKLIMSIVTDSFEKRVDVDVYDMDRNLFCSKLKKNSQVGRGAGRLIAFGEKSLRPAQNSEGGEYGAGIDFWILDESEGTLYESEGYSLSKNDFFVSGKRKTNGVHTYARAKNIEIIDYKSRRINLKRLFWILKRKFN